MAERIRNKTTKRDILNQFYNEITYTCDKMCFIVFLLSVSISDKKVSTQLIVRSN